MKKTKFGCCLLCILFLLPSSPTLAADRYYLLLDARVLVSEGHQAEAMAKYLEYIDSHPAITGKRTAAYKRNSQYYLRNLLIAFSNLLDQQRKAGLNQEVLGTLDRLQQVQKDNWFGSKNLYKLARIFKENGDLQKAVPYLQTIISDQIKDPKRTNNKVFVRACTDLIAIHRSTGNARQVTAVLLSAARGLEQFGFDLKDRYRIGRLMLENGDEKNGQKILADMIQSMSLDDLNAEEDAIIRAVVKLMNINANDANVTTAPLVTLDKFGNAHELSPRNQYSLGIACLGSGKKQRGIKLLEKIKDSYPETTYARKALFVLARMAANASDWTKAIDHYAEYIERYPKPRFFSLKAYSRLIDCQWAQMKDPRLTEAETHRLADLVNNIADYETQLNLARDLKDKGFDKLADATFEMGMADAQNLLQTHLEDEDRIRILWTIQKYAYPLEKFSVVEDSSHQLFRLLADPAKAQLRSSEKGRFFKAQSYIWLAQTYRDTARLDEAVKAYSNFLTEFPKSKDANYVRYSLAGTFEQKGDLPRAKGFYEKIDAGVWKKRASQKLHKQGQPQ